LIVSLLEGCTSLAYLPGQQTIGTLRIIGPNVQVNAAPAIDSQTITRSLSENKPLKRATPI
jgi:hypothetical protein